MAEVNRLWNIFNQNPYKSRPAVIHRYRFEIMGIICNQTLQLKCPHISFFLLSLKKSYKILDRPVFFFIFLGFQLVFVFYSLGRISYNFGVDSLAFVVLSQGLLYTWTWTQNMGNTAGGERYFRELHRFGFCYHAQTIKTQLLVDDYLHNTR